MAPRKQLTAEKKEFLAAAARGDLQTVQQLLSEGVAIETSDANEMTALHHAAKHARDDVIRYLVERGANANASDLTGGFSPVHWVIIYSCPQMSATNHIDRSIVALCRGGCDVNAKDFNLATPLHLAVQKGYRGTISALLQLGADPHRLDVMGRDCFRLAKNEDIRKLLRSHEKRESAVYHVLENPGMSTTTPSSAAAVYHVLEAPEVRTPPVIYHVLEAPSSSSSSPAIPAPPKKQRRHSIIPPPPLSLPSSLPSSPPLSANTSLLRNLPKFQPTPPGYPPPPPPPRSSTPVSSSRCSTPEYSVVNIPIPTKLRPLPVPPAQVPSPLYHCSSAHSSPIPPPHAIARTRLSRKSHAYSSIRDHRKH